MVVDQDVLTFFLTLIRLSAVFFIFVVSQVCPLKHKFMLFGICVLLVVDA